MSNLTNILGKLGEHICGAELMRPVTTPAGLRYLFDAVLIGGSGPTYDYEVFILDKGHRRSGPHFLLQVKATIKRVSSEGYKMNFSRRQAAAAYALKIPFYIVIVDLTISRCERLFIKAVEYTNGGRPNGISRLRPRRDLADDRVKLLIAAEVDRYWARVPRMSSSEID